MGAQNEPAAKVATPAAGSRTEASAVANIVRRLAVPRTLRVQGCNSLGAEVLLVPEGFEAYSVKEFLDEYLARPERRKGTAELSELESFIEHVTRFKGASSAIFADRNVSAPTLTCVLDYHEAGSHGLPAFCEHRARYAFPLSDEWREWKAKNGKQFNQTEFAEFIENRIGDVCPPGSAGSGALEFAERLGCDFASAQKLLELSRGLEVRVDSRLKNAVKLESGESQLIFEEKHGDQNGAPLRIPSAFIIAIPVFRGGPGYQLPVRLRYRAREGGISWFFEIYRDDITFDDAFLEACERAGEATGLPLFMGKPE